MIKQLRLVNWKSFEDATLYIDPLTALIGANASGKSNILEALLFLKRIASGMDFTTALKGDQNIPPIRGGLEWAALKPHTTFRLSVTIQSEENKDVDYRYDINLEIVNNKMCNVIEECFIEIKQHKKTDGIKNETVLFNTSNIGSSIVVYNRSNGKVVSMSPSYHSALNTMREHFSDNYFSSPNLLFLTLKNIFILDPIPSHMRGYTPLSDELLPDASNIAGVIAGLPEVKQKELEDIITKYVKHLPEKDIQRVYSEKVGKFGSDAMLYCEEMWHDGEIQTVDARGMSDGTLRFIAIITAIMTRPKNSLLVIEEIDNGLHPSRVGLLIQILKEVAAVNKIDVLFTTHNPALLNALGPEQIPFISVVHRDPKKGTSKITLLEDVEDITKLIASGPIGDIVTKGKLEESLQETEEP